MKQRIGINTDSIFDTCVIVLTTLAFAVTLYPFIYIVAVSLSESRAVYEGRVFIVPVNPTLVGYRQVLRQDGLWTAYGNTIFYTVVGTFFNIAATTIAAYPLSRRKF